MNKIFLSLLTIALISAGLLYSVDSANAKEENTTFTELKCRFNPDACKDKSNG